MPEGVFLLSQIKRLSEVWKTGATKHATKFMRIARILEAYPDSKIYFIRRRLATGPCDLCQV